MPCEIKAREGLKPIKDFPNYFIDLDSNIYSTKFRKPRKLKQAVKNTQGVFYKGVTLSRHNKKHNRLTHRLMLETFKPTDDKSLISCHGKLGSLNNSLENLSWGTHAKNVGEDRYRDNTMLKGTNVNTCKLNEEKVRNIRRLHKHKMPLRKIVALYKMSQTQISKIIKGESWRWVK